MSVLVLSELERRNVLDAVLRSIATKFVRRDVDVSALRVAHQTEILRSRSHVEFESAMNDMLRELGVSHVGFFHESSPRTSGRVAIAATFAKAQTTDGERWVFQDVHLGGAAHHAGVRPGDVLLSVDGKSVMPPEAMPFTLGERYEIVIRRSDGTTASATLAVPRPKDKRHPIVVPEQVVTSAKLAGGIGHLRVSMFPGVLGMDVARDVTRAIADMGCERLIIDLRGNSGGGMGCLRLMSLLCDDRRGVGYSLGRDALETGRQKHDLPVFDRIPASKWGVLPLFVKFARAGRSVAVFTEAAGARQPHRRVAILVNEHSASAAEMVAAFASENRLATLVGAQTAGRVVGASAFKVGHGYRVALPVAAYRTWADADLEGQGVAPDVCVPIDIAALGVGEDVQLTAARVAVDY